MQRALDQYHMWRELVSQARNIPSTLASLSDSTSASTTAFTASASLDKTITIPKIIWLLWYQGWNTAPSIAHFCRQSWQRHHPAESGWTIILLDSENLRQFMNYDVDRIGQYTNDIVAKSALIRFHLLRKYGGLWVDATVFCHQPIDKWIRQHDKKGKVQIQSHILIPSAIKAMGKSLVICSWLMASSKGSPLFARWEEESLRYWLPVKDEIPGRSTPASGQITQVEESKRDEYLKEHYFSGFRGTRIASDQYFWAHLLLNAMQETDPDIRSIIETSSDFLKDQFAMFPSTPISYLTHLLMDSFNMSVLEHSAYAKGDYVINEDYARSEFKMAWRMGGIQVSKLSMKRIASFEKFEEFLLSMDKELEIKKVEL